MDTMASDKAFHVIEQVAAASGNAKKKFLIDGLQMYLLAAYDPYTRYYITSNQIGPIVTHGHEEFTDLHWIILDKLASRELSGTKAIRVIRSIVMDMTLESGKLFLRIIDKDLRMGVGAKTINKVFPGLVPTHDVMLAKIYKSGSMKFPCWGTPKIDGVRAEYTKGRFLSRNGHMYIGLDHMSSLSQFHKTKLDFELAIPGKTFQESSGLIRSDKDTPTAIAWLLEIPTLKVPYEKRIAYMKSIARNHKYVYYLPHYKILNEAHALSYFTYCRKMGYEGAVLRSLDYAYTGTRSAHWQKMKAINSIDTKVHDIFEGAGKYKGQLGGVIINYNGHEVKVGTGFSDKERRDFYADPTLIVDHTIEVIYMEETDGGSLRHPRFHAIRYDK